MALKPHQIGLVENDTKPLQLDFQDDRTGCTVKLHIKYPDEVVVVDCPAIDAAAGTFYCDFSVGDLRPGTYKYEIQTTYPSGEIETCNRLNVGGKKGALLEFVIDEEIA